MPDVHLCIMAGGDNRYPYLRETVRVSQPYFTTIRIVDTGSTDETASLAAHPSVHFERIFGWDDDWPRAYLKVIEGVPENNWFLFVDSDERPSQLLLDHLQHDIAVLEQHGCNIALLPSVLHMDSRAEQFENGGVRRLLEQWPKSNEEYLRKPCWTKPMLVKRLAETTARAFGGHCRYVQPDTCSLYIPHYYNHYKSSSQLAYSIVFCSWACIESHNVPVGSPEQLRHEAFRETTGIRTTADLSATISGRAIPEIVVDYFRTMRDSPNQTLRHYWEFAFVYQFRVTLALEPCPDPCCRYADHTLSTGAIFGSGAANGSFSRAIQPKIELLKAEVPAESIVARQPADPSRAKVVTIAAYRRLAYTRQVVEALSRCAGIDDYLVLFHLEPGYPEIVDLAFSAPLANKRIVLNETRLGCTANTYQALDHGFRYADFVVHIEDDCVPSRDCLRYFEWARHTYREDPAVFTVTSYSRDIPPPEQYFAAQRFPWFTPWGMGTWSDRWAEMRDRWGFGEVNSWDICVNNLRGGRVQIQPYLARTQNIGAEWGTHCPSPEWHRENHFNEFGAWSIELDLSTPFREQNRE